MANDYRSLLQKMAFENNSFKPYPPTPSAVPSGDPTDPNPYTRPSTQKAPMGVTVTTRTPVSDNVTERSFQRKLTQMRRARGQFDSLTRT